VIKKLVRNLDDLVNGKEERRELVECEVCGEKREGREVMDCVMLCYKCGEEMYRRKLSGIRERGVGEREWEGWDELGRESMERDGWEWEGGYWEKEF
jgi:hypothetical protein